MAKKEHKTVPQVSPAHGYEFGGPLGAFGVSFGLPIVCYLMVFLCNDKTGCPAPSLLHPSSFSLDKLVQETGWPGFLHLLDAEALMYTTGYHLFSLVLYASLPGTEVEGTELATGGKLKYKFNAFTSALITLGLAAIGTAVQGPDFPLWTYIWDHQPQLITANLLIAFTLATFVYINSFSVRPKNKQQRELAQGGHTGSLIYDWFIGRELNPRINLPLIGLLDIKVFCELRPGMLGWILLNLTHIAHQYKTHHTISDSILLLTAFQTLYVLDALYMEPAMLTTIDITTDGFGFMLAFGDLVWLPFIYSLQARYLAVYPLHLGLSGIALVLAPQAIGYYIFRSANNEKNRFRTDPSDPRVAHLTYIETQHGSRLITSGWWGAARHINYLGDWIMAWSYCLPTGVAGYIIQKSDWLSLGGKEVVQGEARGWGMPVTYFYLLYFAVLLVHREMRDEEKCRRKYGRDWEEYCEKVPWRIVPYIY